MNTAYESQPPGTNTSGTERKKVASCKSREEIVAELSTDERYAAFLIQEWKKLAQVPLRAADQPPASSTGVLKYTIDYVSEAPGLRLEFGVWRGNSIRMCAGAYPEHKWYGFDSFEGFPDDGRIDWQKPFKVIELPDTPNNVTLIKGYFSDTLSPFLQETPGELAFINVDCDIYSSTVDIFKALKKHDRLHPGLVIFFDELINYADYMWNESLALFEILEETGFGVEWLAYDHHLRSPEESVRHFYEGDHPTWMDDMHSGHWMQASCRLISKGIEYGPVEDPAYREKLRWMVAGMKLREKARHEEYEARQQRLKEMDEERERRYVERKKREKENQRVNLEQRRAEQRTALGQELRKE